MEKRSEGRRKGGKEGKRKGRKAGREEEGMGGRIDGERERKRNLTDYLMCLNMMRDLQFCQRIWG